MKAILKLVAAVSLLMMGFQPAQATIISVVGPPSDAGGLAAIIAPPSAALDGSISALGQRGFDEQQNVLLTSAISVDGGGTIAAGTVVDSHMILLNRVAGGPATIVHTGVTWTFSGTIIGVMTDSGGLLEAASTDQLGSLTTLYPTAGGGSALGGSSIPTYAGFPARGLEGGDSIIVGSNFITLTTSVGEPGDWIRVITVPEPASFALFVSGLFGLALWRRRVLAVSGV